MSEYSCISSDVTLGKNVKLSKFLNLYGCTVGDNSKIGAFVEIQKNAVIGKNCKISSHTFICEGVTIEDGVFIGHNVTFINDKYPHATNGNGELQRDGEWRLARRSAPAPPFSRMSQLAKTRSWAPAASSRGTFRRTPSSLETRPVFSGIRPLN